MLHGQITDSEIADSISKWLSQATLRTQREKYVHLSFSIAKYTLTFIKTYFLYICATNITNKMRIDSYLSIHM